MQMKDTSSGTQRSQALVRATPVCCDAATDFYALTVPIENIKEIRSGPDGRYYREQFQLSSEYEDRWLTIIYIVDGRYKTLHVVAPSVDIFRELDKTLRDLFAVRQELMSGLGHVEERQKVWERRYWAGADEEKDHKLSFAEVERMCKRLNLNYAQADLRSRFDVSDVTLFFISYLICVTTGGRLAKAGISRFR